jgi:peptidoglycan hydrolase-like protein with peptidoglycan-binding domain
MTISGSVGRGGVNRAGDVRLVQHLLNDYRARVGSPLLAVNGTADQATEAAIEQYQRQNGLTVDGHIDPSSPTLAHLVQSFLASLGAGVIQPPLPLGPAEPVSEEMISFALGEFLSRLRS